jgi:hypothetical protein
MAGTLPAIAQEEPSLAGEYSVTLTRTDIPVALPDGFNYVGRWVIAFNDDGMYTVTRLDIGPAVSGTWEADGDRVTITDGSGIISCSNPAAVTIQGEDTATGVYEWTLANDTLTLTPVEDACGGRVLLLTTRALGFYVPCTTTPLETTGIATPVGTPVAVDEEEAGASDPVAEVLTPESATESAPQSGDTEPPGDTAAVAVEIDELLAQITACWATGDPDLWLPLLSTGFRQALIGGDDDFLVTIQAAMATPIVWERAGDVEVASETAASAIVRTTVAQEQDFQRFAFVVEEGEWRWDG